MTEAQLALAASMLPSWVERKRWEADLVEAATKKALIHVINDLIRAMVGDGEESKGKGGDPFAALARLGVKIPNGSFSR